MSKENLQALLGQLGQQIGLPGLALDDDDYCLLRVDAQLDVGLEFIDDQQALVLCARCGALTDHNRQRVLAEMADANFYWVGSGGGTLATNSREGAVYLQYREATAHLTLERLEQLLHAVVSNAGFWHSRLAQADEAPAPPAPALPQDLHSGWRA